MDRAKKVESLVVIVVSQAVEVRKHLNPKEKCVKADRSKPPLLVVNHNNDSNSSESKEEVARVFIVKADLRYSVALL